jgi:hypothetical protein
MPNIQEKNAMTFVEKWSIKHRIKFQRKKKSGYDYDFIFPNGTVKKIEVKGTSKVDKIPDLYESEVKDMKIVADFLYVVGNVRNRGNEILYVIPRDDIKSENLRPSGRWRIARFQNKKTMGKYRKN